MGMFTWCCKGCGNELIAGEYVRMNGCQGEYDGYGGAGGFSYEDGEPSCWHVRCYNNATDKQKLDDTPSKYGENQGFGAPVLANRRGFKPDTGTIFSAIVFVDLEQEWHVNKPSDYILVNMMDYRRQYEAAAKSDEFDIFIENKDYEGLQNAVEQKIGMTNPEENRMCFTSFAQAKEVVLKLIEQLPNPELGYDLYIYGHQGEVYGLCYNLQKIPVKSYDQASKCWRLTGNFREKEFLPASIPELNIFTTE